MKKIKLTISVYDFDDFHEFLKAAYEDMNRQDSDFSYRYIQTKAGFSPNSNHFWQKASGHSPTSQQAAMRYARAFGLSPKETQFFQLLVAMNQAKTDDDRNYYLEQLKQFSNFKSRKTRGRINYQYYSDWCIPALRAIVTLDDFREDYTWIATKIKPPITAKKAREGIRTLLKLGYLVRDDNGRLQQATPFIGGYTDRSGDDPVAKLAIRNFHRFMIEQGAASIENHPQLHRYVVGNTMAVSYRQAEMLRKMVGEFMQQVETFIAKDEPIETVFRLNVQLFPLVDTTDTFNAGDGIRATSEPKGKKAVNSKPEGKGGASS